MAFAPTFTGGYPAGAAGFGGFPAAGFGGFPGAGFGGFPAGTVTGAPFGSQVVGTVAGPGLPYSGAAPVIGANTVVGGGAGGALLNGVKTAVYSGGAGYPISSWPSPVINDETERIKLSQKFRHRHQRAGFDFDWQANPPAGSNVPNLQYAGASVRETRYLSGATHVGHGLIPDNRLYQNTMIQGAPVAQRPGGATVFAPTGFGPALNQGPIMGLAPLHGGRI